MANHKWAYKCSIYDERVCWWEHTGDPFATVQKLGKSWVAQVYLTPTQVVDRKFAYLKDAKRWAIKAWEEKNARV